MKKEIVVQCVNKKNTGMAEKVGEELKWFNPDYSLFDETGILREDIMELISTLRGCKVALEINAEGLFTSVEVLDRPKDVPKYVLGDRSGNQPSQKDRKFVRAEDVAKKFHEEYYDMGASWSPIAKDIDGKLSTTCTQNAINKEMFRLASATPHFCVEMIKALTIPQPKNVSIKPEDLNKFQLPYAEELVKTKALKKARISLVGLPDEEEESNPELEKHE